jgi:hypothetical protein
VVCAPAWCDAWLGLLLEGHEPHPDAHVEPGAPAGPARGGRRFRGTDRLYVLAFLSIGSRRVEYLACTSKPNTDWMLQQARNLLKELDGRDRQLRFLLHDRDAKFPPAFDALPANDGVKVTRTPAQAPNANAHVERWLGSVRECLDRLLIAVAAVRSNTSSAAPSSTTTDRDPTLPSI